MWICVEDILAVRLMGWMLSFDEKLTEKSSLKMELPICMPPAAGAYYAGIGGSLLKDWETMHEMGGTLKQVKA